jgi:hypothetical protein
MYSVSKDNYLEEAYKMRNVLQEFVHHSGNHAPIIRLREHIFTGKYFEHYSFHWLYVFSIKAITKQNLLKTM